MQENNQSLGQNKKRGWVRQALLTLLCIGAILSAYVGGFTLGREEGQKGAFQTGGEGGKVINKDARSSASLLQNADFNLYWDVWKWIQGNFIDNPIDEKKLFYGSLAGMVASLDDPYSAFMEPKLAQEFSEELQGKFQGIGAEIGIRDKKLTVIAPLPETPAEGAGLKSGDWIIEIDGTDTTGMMLDDAVNRIRGEKSTQVKLLIMRENFKEPKIFTITRDDIKIVSVRSEVKEGGIVMCHPGLKPYLDQNQSSCSTSASKELEAIFFEPMLTRIIRTANNKEIGREVTSPLIRVLKLITMVRMMIAINECVISLEVIMFFMGKVVI